MSAPITIQLKGSTIIRIGDVGYTGLICPADTETTTFIISGILRFMSQGHTSDITITGTNTLVRSVQDTLTIRESTAVNQNIIKEITAEVTDVDVAMGTIDNQA